MYSMTRRRDLGVSLVWVLVAAVAFLLVILLLAAGRGYLGASLAGPDVAREFRPLVRHQISQQHAYDDGTQFSEKQGFSKEFTLAYLFHRKNKMLKTRPLYSCVDLKQGLFFASTEVRECRTLGLRRTYLLGYLAGVRDFEAPAAIYRCVNVDSGDALLTDDAGECALLGGYSEAELLGYAASAGHLPQRRLNELCDVVSTVCPGAPEVTALPLVTGLPTVTALPEVPKVVCDAQASLCHGLR